MLTRGNAVFLAAGATCVLPRRSWRAALAYALGLAAPLAAWHAVAAAAGGLPADRNYLNVAWELYGRGVPWERFEPGAGARFHSLLDVLRYDPAGAARHVAANLARHRAWDLSQLVPAWLGVFAVPGAVVLARRVESRAWLAHAAACAIVLAPAFYNARFGLFLAPVYLACAGIALERLPRHVPRAWSRPAAAACAAALVAASAVTSSLATTAGLRDAPDETRIAGRALAARGLHGAIAARKPHVAWFAGLDAAPFPSGVPLPRLAATTRMAGAQYLFYSDLEQVLRPEYGVLADSAAALPGLTQLLWGRTSNGHAYAAYRVGETAPDSLAFVAAWRAAIERYEARRAGSGTAQLFVAAQYLELGDPEAALARLDGLVRGGARDAAVERYRSTALLALGRYDESARACADAMRDGEPTGWDWDRIGGVRAIESRWPEAVAAFTNAAAIEPANTAYLDRLGRAATAAHDYARAAAAFERRLRLDPCDVAARRAAMGAWQLAGNTTRFRRLYAEGLASGVNAAALAGGP